MAAGTSFKQQCPSCEAMVPIRDPGLVGRKIDCPKCKYRFVVEEPGGGEEEEAPKPSKKKGDKGGDAKGGAAKGPDKGDKGGKNGKGASKAGPRRRGADDEEDERPSKKSKKAAGGGMLILGGGLAVVALVAIVVVGITLSGNSGSPSNNSGNSGSTGGPGSTGSNLPVTGDPGKQDNPVEPAGVLVNVTNLLPNDTQAVISYPVPATLGSSLRTGGLDGEAEAGYRGERFRATMGFSIDDVNRVVTAMHLKDDWLFTLVQLKKPYKQDTMKTQLRLVAQPAVKSKTGKDYQVFQMGKDLDSLSNLLVKVNKQRDTLAVHFYDSNTIVFADPKPLRQFLTEDTTPTYKSTLNSAAPQGTPTGPATGMMGGMPPAGMMGGMPPAGMMGGMPPTGMMGGMPAGMMGGMPPAGMMGGNPNTTGGNPGSDLTAPASYMTVDAGLKAVLDKIEKVEPHKVTRKMEPTSLVTAAGLMTGFQTTVNQILTQAFNEANIPAVERLVLQPLITSEVKRLNAVGMSLVAFEQNNAGLALAVHSDIRTAEALDKRLRPFLPRAVPLFKQALGLEVTVPQAMGGMNMGMGIPGIGLPATGGMIGMPPGTMIGSSPGTGNPNDPNNMGDRKNDGTLSLEQEGAVVVARLNLNLTNEAFEVLYPISKELVAYVKSQSDLAANQPRYHTLGRALDAYVKEKGQFPPGAMQRAASSDRSLPWRPDQRLSWVVALLPYLGDEYSRWQVDLEKGWNEENGLVEAVLSGKPVQADALTPNKNVVVGARLVAPLLAHRLAGVSQPYVAYPNKPFPVAATHFVAIAGVGLDAAEYPAGNPATAKKAGLFGYDRVTKAADVKDKVENTIAFLLVPDEHKAPWIAGGGATLRAVADEGEDAKPLAPFVCVKYPGKSEDKRWADKKGTIAVMGDGRVRFIPADLPAATFRALCTIAGEEKVPGRLDDVCPLIEEEAAPAPPVLRTETPPAKAPEKPAEPSTPMPKTGNGDKQ